MNMKKLVPFVACAALAVSATPGHSASRPKSISYKEASAFELSLLAQGSPAPNIPEAIYIQPINKSEVCKLPTSKDQIERPNFRSYWDGECRNGFAFGIGRDIAISDTHHVEEITIHDGTGMKWSRPSVLYDYVNNEVSYSVGGEQFPSQTVFREKMDNSISGLSVLQYLTVMDESGRVFYIQKSPFQFERYYVLTQQYGAVAYQFTDLTTAPVTNPTSSIFVAQVIDPRKSSWGTSMVRYANGEFGNFRFVNGTTETVSFPTAYIDHLKAKYQEILTATSHASVILQRAQQIEREYLFKACNGKSGIKGLDNADYTKICTWRDQFKEPYAIAAANYERQIESLKQQAATAEQQQLQLQTAQQQRNQQSWNELNRANQQLQQQTQQFMNGVNNWRAPQVQPITPPGGNKVICNTIGSITVCR